MRPSPCILGCGKPADMSRAFPTHSPVVAIVDAIIARTKLLMRSGIPGGFAPSIRCSMVRQRRRTRRKQLKTGLKARGKSSPRIFHKVTLAELSGYLSKALMIQDFLSYCEQLRTARIAM